MMKKCWIAVVLILSLLYIWTYPCIYSDQVQDAGINHMETPMNHSVQTIAIGTLSIGETVAGFSLAEVVLVLTIIGSIASFTIPPLIQDFQDKVARTEWKEGYSIINQVITRMKFDQGGSIANLCNSDDNDCFRDKFGNYLSGKIKKANSGLSYGNCWSPGWKLLNGTDDGGFSNGLSCMTLPNGMFMLFYWFSQNGTSDGSTGGTIRLYGTITVDVNGFKGPNVLGKDIFQAYILSSDPAIVKPAGISGSGSDMNTCNTSNVGWSCAYEYLKQ